MLTTLLFILPPAHAAPAEVADTWRYAGPSGESEQDLDAIVSAIVAAPDGKHYLWQPGWPEWKSWEDIPEIKAAVDARRSPLPPPAPTSTTSTETWSYSDGGAPLTLTTAEIAERIKANPGGRHLVWKAGMTDWTSAADLPAFASATSAAAPPPPPTRTPPPPPVAAPPPAPTTKAPTTKATPSAEPGHAAPAFQVGADVRSSFAVNDLGYPETPPTITFELNRFRPFIAGSVGDNWSAVVSVELTQNDAMVDTNGKVTKPSTWSILPDEAYAQGGFTTGKVDHYVRVGAQHTVFGARDYFDGYDGYYVGGKGSQDLPRLFGALYGEDLGLRWHSGIEGKFGVDVQVTNGEGIASTDTDGAIDILARVEARPIKYVGLWGSFMTGGRDSVGGLASLTLADFGAELAYGPARVYGEVLLGALGNVDFNYPVFGALGAAAVDIPLSPPALDHLGLVARYAGYDPIQGNEVPDASYAIAGGANLFWNAGEARTALTGVQFETTIPQSLDLPITHDVTLQFAAKF